jgi:iron complex transport system substrate-binding protein
MKVRIVSLLVASLITGTVNAQTRIITAGSAITEIVCALGDCEKIIASDRTSMFPEQIQKLPSIGYRSGINAEGIISLKPTIIFAEKNYVEEAVIGQIRSSGVQLVVVDERRNFEDTKRAIMQVATALGKVEEGKKLIGKNQTELEEARALLSKTKVSPRVLCVYNRGAGTVSVAGTNTFAGILVYTGATNTIQNVEGYKPLNTEALIAADPEYILMLSTGLESIGGLEGALKIPGVAQTTAGKKKQIIGIESLRLTNFGPRFGQTVKELVVLLHPELKAK